MRLSEVAAVSHADVMVDISWVSDRPPRRTCFWVLEVGVNLLFVQWWPRCWYIDPVEGLLGCGAVFKKL